MQTREIQTKPLSGWGMITLLLAVGVALGLALFVAVRIVNPWLIVSVSLPVMVWVFLLCGFFTLQPNQAAALILFGKYHGTTKESGFFWANPLYTKKKVSQRAHNLNGSTIKVNDLRGNPVEIAAVVVWRVADTAQALFDVVDFESFVSVQSESALRHLASIHPYDITTDDVATSLRGSRDEVSAALQQELQERVAKAGVVIDEAWLSHLAYAPEIAAAMLRRQQAEAVVAARTRIVDGAVGMVELALEKLESHGILKLDEERKAAMVSNLLVVLCSESAAHPVVNTGTLYT